MAFEHHDARVVRDVRGHAFAVGGARRIVSLVPSLTETVIALGGGHRLVGRTRWCVHPADRVSAIPVVGGTKDADVDAIRALRPDLVLANQEENVRELTDSLEPAVPVHVSFPRSPEEAISLVADVARLLDLDGSVEVDAARSARKRARAEAVAPPVRSAVLVWWRPLMLAGEDTYVARLFGELGAQVVAPPSEDRYPTTNLDGLAALAPEAVWLPDEPFRFTERHVSRVRDELARRGVREVAVAVLPGDLVTWHGVRTRRALERLPELLAVALKRSTGG
jgi:ABC-type hemin transport system substrate-binding protein